MGDLEYLARIGNGELTGGTLVNVNSNISNSASIIGTVPAGKDWYLLRWSSSTGTVNGSIGLQYPTGTTIEIIRLNSSTGMVYFGISSGFKITAGETITLTAFPAMSQQTGLLILEMDAGVSPEMI